MKCQDFSHHMKTVIKPCRNGLRACVHFPVALVQRPDGTAFREITAISLLHVAIRLAEHVLRCPAGVGAFAPHEIGQQGAHQMTVDFEVLLQAAVDV